jgi:hypothetical protein
MASEGVHRKKKRASAEEGSGEEASGFFPDLLRRGLTLGFTGFFLTEEALRKALGDSVPRDVLEFMLDQSQRMRAEFLDRISNEFGRVLERADPVDLARRLLEGGTVEVTARFQLVPKDQIGTERKNGSRSEKKDGTEE